MEPTSVEYHIHQVVNAFHVINESQAYQNIPLFLVSPSCCWMKNKGTKATKISGAKPFSGQEAANNNPLKSDKRSK